MSELNPYETPKQQSVDPAIALEPRVVAGGQGWNWIAEAWALFAKSPGIWIANFIICVVIYFALAWIPLIGHVADSLLMPVFAGGLMLGCRALQRGEKFEVSHVFAGFQVNTSQLVLLGVFYLVAGIVIAIVGVAVVMLTGGAAIISGLWAAVSGGNLQAVLAGGTILVFLLIGLLVLLLLSIPIAMAGWFAPPLVVLRDVPALEAIRLSFVACLKNFVPFLVYGIVLFVLSILASIPAGLGWLVLGPVVIASIYAGYRDIFPGS